MQARPISTSFPACGSQQLAFNFTERVCQRKFESHWSTAKERENKFRNALQGSVWVAEAASQAVTSKEICKDRRFPWQTHKTISEPHREYRLNIFFRLDRTFSGDGVGWSSRRGAGRQTSKGRSLAQPFLCLLEARERRLRALISCPTTNYTKFSKTERRLCSRCLHKQWSVQPSKISSFLPRPISERNHCPLYAVPWGRGRFAQSRHLKRNPSNAWISHIRERLVQRADQALTLKLHGNKNESAFCEIADLDLDRWLGKRRGNFFF